MGFVKLLLMSPDRCLRKTMSHVSTAGSQAAERTDAGIGCAQREPKEVLTLCPKLKPQLQTLVCNQIASHVAALHSLFQGEGLQG